MEGSSKGTKGIMKGAKGTMGESKGANGTMEQKKQWENQNIISLPS